MQVAAPVTQQESEACAACNKKLLQDSHGDWEVYSDLYDKHEADKCPTCTDDRVRAARMIY